MEIRHITDDEILEIHIAVERANGAHGNEGVYLEFADLSGRR